jgi:hypothetical protein
VIDHVTKLMSKYRDGGLLIDSNLLLLLLVGDVDRSWITRYERTRNYDEVAYDAVAAAIKSFGPKLVTTPHILTVVSNLAGHLKQEIRTRFFRRFAEMIERLLTELPVQSVRAAREKLFDQFGLSDLTTMLLAKGQYLVLTDDLPLAGYLSKCGVDVLTLGEIKPLAIRRS